MALEIDLQKYLESFSLDEKTGSATAVKTELAEFSTGGINTLYYVNEFWTSRQRQAASIHEISYRACFKPQLPCFFIDLLTSPGDTVYDPFAGRGTTAVEAALLGRNIVANDINPLSRILSEPRLAIPTSGQVSKRLESISLDSTVKNKTDLSMFYHPRTERELLALRAYLRERRNNSTEDSIDRWIRMVATSRLSGHSRGFFSVYTMPPNQAVSRERQAIINDRRKQKPEYRNIRSIILKKTVQLLRNLTTAQLDNLQKAAKSALFLESDAAKTKTIPGRSIELTVTSPPFLDVVQYSKDNWLRCWFNDIDLDKLEKELTMAANLDEWSEVMTAVFNELYRVTRPGGWVAFEVGEVRRGKIKLEEVIVPTGINCGFQCKGVVINRQNFTKTSNIWGINNNLAGTNSNRIVIFNKKITG